MHVLIDFSFPLLHIWCICNYALFLHLQKWLLQVTLFQYQFYQHIKTDRPIEAETTQKRNEFLHIVNLLTCIVLTFFIQKLFLLKFSFSCVFLFCIHHTHDGPHHPQDIVVRGGARGGLGGYISPSEASSPLSEEILGYCRRKFGKMTYENSIFAILAPLVGSSSPSVGRFLAPPLIVVLTFSQSPVSIFLVLFDN